MMPKGHKLTAEQRKHISIGRKRYFRMLAAPKKKGAAYTLVRKYHPEVTNVIDAKQPLTIEVTDDDRVKGSKTDPKACALARACGRTWDGAIIGLKTVYLIKGKRAIRYMTPEAIAREIVSFDRHQDFAAGSYKLRPPKGTLRLGVQHPWSNHSHTGSQKGRTQHKTVRVRSLRG